MRDYKPPYPCPHKNKLSAYLRIGKIWNSWIHGLFEKSYDMKLGSVKLPKMKMFMPCEKELVDRVMRKEYKDFPKHSIMAELLEPLLGESIFTTNGKIWERQRKMMNPSFAMTHLKKVFPLMSSAINEMTERFEKLVDENELVNVDIEMTHVTADVIFRTILSHPLSNTEAHEIYEAFTIYQEVSQKIVTLKVYGIPSFFMYKKRDKAGKRIKNILAGIIKERYDEFLKGENKYSDILYELMIAKDDEGKSFGYDELVDHVSMLFLAGHETSASALTWSIYLIAACPDVQQRIYEEVSKFEGEMKYEDVKEFKFVGDVFKESLRLYPPVGFFTRESLKETKMRNKTICPGDSIMISPWLIQRNKTNWENADSFIPERFSSDDEKTKESIKCSYMPFGDGPRICVGAGFATQEAIMILASLVRRFEFKTSEKHVPEPVGRLTIRPKDGVWVNMKKR